MGNKTIMLVCILVSAILMGASQVQGQVPTTLLGVSIQANVSCVLNGTSTPLRNAQVQLTCGNGTVVANATTSSSGMVNISLVSIIPSLPSGLGPCRLVANTSLSSCNAGSPSVNANLQISFLGRVILLFRLFST